ncbi:PDZ domain-containing protein [bacterium]|nr:PDZ domain-containing protein [bacterium]
MPRIVSLVVAFAAGVVVATVAGWLQVPEAPPPPPPRPPLTARGVDPPGGRAGGGDSAQRQRDLERRLEQETAARQRAEQQLAELHDHLQALGDAAAAPPAEAQAPPLAVAAAPPPVDGAAANAEAAADAVPTPVDYSKSEMERALIAGGMDANQAADLKRRADTLALAEMYLRDQATREDWVDTPRYQEELDSLHQQQVSIRDELGDDGYDRYLFALGQTNRVRVDDVMTDSPAAQAGLAQGDVIVRYGDTRVFAPAELVTQTQLGEPGEWVQLLITRQGVPMTVQVPRGPLGLRVNATQTMPMSTAADGRQPRDSG